MSSVDNLFNTINRGRSGLNVGLITGLQKLDLLTYGIQRKWMTVISGDSGSVYSIIKNKFKFKLIIQYF